jgi:hypothetical protein
MFAKRFASLDDWLGGLRPSGTARRSHHNQNDNASGTSGQNMQFFDPKLELDREDVKCSLKIDTAHDSDISCSGITLHRHPIALWTACDSTLIGAYVRI